MDIQTKEVKPNNMKNINRMRSFSERWKIGNDENRIELRIRCLAVISHHINYEFLTLSKQDSHVQRFLDKLCSDLCMIMGISYTRNNSSNFENSSIYHHICNLDLSSEIGYNRFIYFIEVLVNYDSMLIVNEELATNISEVLKLSNANFKIIQDESDYYLIPLEVDFLDNPLIIDNLYWLNRYADSKEHFLKALEFNRSENYFRNIIDELRLSLEFLFKQKFNNSKSLENQLSDIGKFFSENNISVNISNMYQKLLKLYTSYNNDNAKHGDKVSEIEIDYLIYLTGTFIRLIIQIELTKDEVK